MRVADAEIHQHEISLVEDGPGRSKIEDLTPHNSDAPVITCIQLQNLVGTAE